MGEITIHPQDLDRLLTDGTSSRPRTISYQQAYVDIAATHYGRPVSEILPLLHAAAHTAGVPFTEDDLTGQAEAIRAGVSYELRVRVSR
ncbi:hypothetical protein [Streptomyces sp. WAC08241]|uniref:hypothetical protein n=1 Tax=Streptomyces sp. WAC08241 TaxID=2487421 RepID=UPI000F7A4769|nr:hypothetical protein [Streptomyces sp. WAC08241]RSS38912.1 hypothetical protein EF906_20050 [Streptomyces sp. WAC08241]